MMTCPPMLCWGRSQIRGELYAEPQALPRVNNDFAEPQAGVERKTWKERERLDPRPLAPYTISMARPADCCLPRSYPAPPWHESLPDPCRLGCLSHLRALLDHS